MIDFLFLEGDWIKNKFKFIGRRTVTFKIALNLFLQYHGKIIVETGCQRMKDDPAGSSTSIFGYFCKQFNKKLYTVDNNLTYLGIAKKLTEEYKDYIEYVYSDSVKFLREFNKPVDLLFLDSLDCPLPPESALTSQLHQLKEIEAAYPHLHKNSVVLLDDNNFSNGGKTRLSKKFLYESRAFTLIYDDDQSLWVKRI